SDRRKSKHEKRAAERMDRNLASFKGTAELKPLEKLTRATRIPAVDGHSGGLAGQITARANSTGHFFTLAFALGFNTAHGADFLRFDDDLSVLAGNDVPKPGEPLSSLDLHRPHIQAVDGQLRRERGWSSGA